MPAIGPASFHAIPVGGVRRPPFRLRAIVSAPPALGVRGRLERDALDRATPAPARHPVVRAAAVSGPAWIPHRNSWFGRHFHTGIVQQTCLAPGMPADGWGVAGGALRPHFGGADQRWTLRDDL
jgi:hypothetical protein